MKKIYRQKAAPRSAAVVNKGVIRIKNIGFYIKKNEYAIQRLRSFYIEHSSIKNITPSRYKVNKFPVNRTNEGDPDGTFRQKGKKKL